MTDKENNEDSNKQNDITPFVIKSELDNSKDNIQNEQIIPIQPLENKRKRIKKTIVSILVLLIILTTSLVGYIYFAGASFLLVETTGENCCVYIEDKKRDFQRLEIPTKESDTYSYDFDIEILIKDTPDTMYLVTFTLDCDKYDFLATSSFELSNGVYSKVVSAGEKTTLISKIGFASNSKVERFKVYLNIDVQKI